LNDKRKENLQTYKGISYHSGVVVSHAAAEDSNTFALQAKVNLMLLS
jgi:hypothetical protein